MEDAHRNSPVAFWFWNGELQPDELVRQLGLFRDSGIWEVVTHARSGLKTAYLSEAWFTACEAVIKEAARSGMRVWLYDEVNWPSGSCGGVVTANPELVEHHIDDDGRLRCFDDPDKAALSPDYLSKAAVDLFIASTHEEYFRRFGQFFGNTVAGFFNDEMRFANAEPWSLELPNHEQFSTPERIRIAGIRFREVYIKAMSDWCTAHGVALMGHLMGEESLASQVRYLAGDLTSALKYFHVPGIDHLGDKAEGLHPAFLASAAHFMGDPPTICETGAALPWEFTETDLRRVTGWLYAYGVKRQVLHGFFYEPNGDDWPPDMFFRWKHWADMQAYAQWAGRVQSYREKLTPIYKVAVYLPIDEYIDDYQPDRRYTLDYKTCDPIGGEHAQALHIAVQEIANELKRQHIEFVFATRADISKLQEELLVLPLDCQVEYGGSVIRQGEQSARDLAARVADALPARATVIGDRACCEPLPARADIADPYVHLARDEGGVVLKTYREGDRTVLSLWNAEGQAFQGHVRLPGRTQWLCWDPRTNEVALIRGDKQQGVPVSISPYAFIYLKDCSDLI